MHAPLPPIILASSISLSAVLNYFYPIAKLVPFPHNMFGFLSIVLGFILIVWSCRLFKIYKTTINPKGKPTILIKTGPFSLSRNPIYLGMFLILFGGAIFLGNLTAFIGPIIFAAIINKTVIPFEEKMLQRIFGAEYEIYKRQVRRFV